MQVKEDELAWHKTLIESSVGVAVSGDRANPGRIRNFYRRNYKALDQFDKLWYEVASTKREVKWTTCYIWGVILDCVVNSYSAYCEEINTSIPYKTYVQELIAEIYSYVK